MVLQQWLIQKYIPRLGKKVTQVEKVTEVLRGENWKVITASVSTKLQQVLRCNCMCIFTLSLPGKTLYCDIIKIHFARRRNKIVKILLFVFF
jgi:hypothetical protein